MSIDEVEKNWKESGLIKIKELPDIGIVGLMPFLYTWAIVCGMDKWFYEYRYCYGDLVDALHDFEHWSGEGHPHGPWIKLKGKGVDIENPNCALTKTA